MWRNLSSTRHVNYRLQFIHDKLQRLILVKWWAVGKATKHHPSINQRVCLSWKFEACVLDFSQRDNHNWSRRKRFLWTEPSKQHLLEIAVNQRWSLCNFERIKIWYIFALQERNCESKVTPEWAALIACRVITTDLGVLIETSEEIIVTSLMFNTGQVMKKIEIAFLFVQVPGVNYTAKVKKMVSEKKNQAGYW